MADMGERLRIAEGKTKVIWEGNPDTVLIESKDAITAGDGARKETILGKAALATTTTCNVFRLLDREDVPSHFVRQISPTVFEAHAVDMIPIELVARRVAYGSYLKRNPGTMSGRHFATPEIEFFHKDDSNHDPLLLADHSRKTISRYAASQPVSTNSLLDELSFADYPELRVEVWDSLTEITRRTFEVIERGWAAQGVTLVDMKIECGVAPNGHIEVADVIDNDSWRIWPNGDPSQMKDKQLFRDGKPLGDVMDGYAWVADATGAFLALD